MGIIEPGGTTDVETAVQRILANAGAPANGTFNEQAEKGQLLVDTSAGVLYINTGTKAATVWTVVGTQT